MLIRRDFKKGLIYLALGFIILFALRLTYGFLFVTTPYDGESYSESSGFEFSKNNYASEKVMKGGGVAPSFDQKYEKVASLFSTSSNFNEDEQRVRTLATAHQALIQFEQSSGLEGWRRLNLAIGVPPEQFDTIVAGIKQIGRITSISINKTDKTNEYKDLNAKRISLEKTRDALVELRGKGGKIDEQINLANKLLEIEDEIQSMGVKLGDYDLENEFCTVKFGLVEKRGGLAADIPLGQRLNVAFFWTVKYYVLLLALMLVGSLLVYVLTLIQRKSNQPTDEKSQ